MTPQQEQPAQTTMRIAVASITNEDADFPDAHFIDEWIRKTADGLIESLAKQGYTLAAIPSPSSGLDMERLEAAIYNLVVNEGHGWPRSAVGLPNFVAGVAAEYARLAAEHAE